MPKIVQMLYRLMLSWGSGRGHFFLSGCPYIVRKSHKNLSSFDRSFLHGNIFKNQWAVSAPPPCQIGLMSNDLFVIFDPLIVKISTLPLLCFMIYYNVLKLMKLKKFQIPKKMLNPLLGMAPRDLRVCP